MYTEKKSPKAAHQAGNNPASSTPIFSGKACTCLMESDANPILIELLVCWKLWLEFAYLHVTTILCLLLC